MAFYDVIDSTDLRLSLKMKSIRNFSTHSDKIDHHHIHMQFLKENKKLFYHFRYFFIAYHELYKNEMRFIAQY